ncbi:hypothetical protein [Persicitalea sp.]|uniref:DUF6932 family protein n=1 Tax=Persicitalea sp. TaxID=3100273 RepID=UPI0035934E64
MFWNICTGVYRVTYTSRALRELDTDRIDLFDITDASVSQWLNGSFVTLKSDPEDIDLVNFIPFNDNLDNALEKLIPYFTVGGSMEKYRIDAHLVPVYPESDPRFENTKLRTAYFERWFGHDRDGYSKGFIEIIEP